MIREAAPEDVVYIEALPDHANIHVSPERIRQIAGNPDSFLYIYEEHGVIVGSVHLHLCMDAQAGTARLLF
jgi:N-acetylglutamate synthase-like GNAT family acetyltransferase